MNATFLKRNDEPGAQGLMWRASPGRLSRVLKTGQILQLSHPMASALMRRPQVR